MTRLNSGKRNDFSDSVEFIIQQINSRIDLIEDREVKKVIILLQRLRRASMNETRNKILSDLRKFEEKMASLENRIQDLEENKV